MFLRLQITYWYPLFVGQKSREKRKLRLMSFIKKERRKNSMERLNCKIDRDAKMVLYFLAEETGKKESDIISDGIYKELDRFVHGLSAKTKQKIRQ